MHQSLSLPRPPENKQKELCTVAHCSYTYIIASVTPAPNVLLPRSEMPQQVWFMTPSPVCSGTVPRGQDASDHLFHRFRDGGSATASSTSPGVSVWPEGSMFNGKINDRLP